MTGLQEATLRLVLAMALGGIVGWQRETADKPAGFRTHILVCVGAALFTLISREGFFGSGADPARVASNIVVGIGFLGAGTIWRTGGSVQGLTTAASLWTVAAVGTAAGVGYYAGALITTLIVISVLQLFKVIETRIPRRGYGQIALVVADRPGELGVIGTVLGSLGVNIEHVEVSQRMDDRVSLLLTVRVPPRAVRGDILMNLSATPGVEDAHWEDLGGNG